jgi:hypothetical protein
MGYLNFELRDEERLELRTAASPDLRRRIRYFEPLISKEEI